MKKYIPPIFPDELEEDTKEIKSILYDNGWAIIQYIVKEENFMVRYRENIYWLDNGGAKILDYFIDTPLGAKAIPMEIVEPHLVKIESK